MRSKNTTNASREISGSEVLLVHLAPNPKVFKQSWNTEKYKIVICSYFCWTLDAFTSQTIHRPQFLACTSGGRETMFIWFSEKYLTMTPDLLLQRYRFQVPALELVNFKTLVGRGVQVLKALVSLQLIESVQKLIRTGCTKTMQNIILVRFSFRQINLLETSNQIHTKPSALSCDNERSTIYKWRNICAQRCCFDTNHTEWLIIIISFEKFCWGRGRHVF